jgi:hypothetical protein
MHGSLAFDFPDTGAMSRPADRNPVLGTGVGWVVVADKDQADSMARMLAAEDGYKHFFLSSSNGRRCVSEGDIVMLAGGPAFRVFVYGAAPSPGQLKRLREAVVANFDDGSVTLQDKAPIEMLAVGLSPFGRRERRRQESRTMLERTFESLQCKQIIGNPYLKERLSRNILAAAPKPIDPLLNAIFCRLRADGLLGVQSETDADMSEAAVLYRSAESAFEALQLKVQAAECAKRFKIARILEHANGQAVLPGLKSRRRSVKQLSDLGFVAKRCAAMRIRFDAEDIIAIDFQRREQGTSQYVGEIAIRPDRMLRLVEGLEDSVPAAMVRVGRPSIQNGALTFDLSVRIRQRFAAGLGFDVPIAVRLRGSRESFVGVSGKSCSQVGHPSDMDEHGNATVRLTAKRLGRHRVELRIAEGLILQQFPVSFRLGA